MPCQLFFKTWSTALCLFREASERKRRPNTGKGIQRKGQRRNRMWGSSFSALGKEWTGGTEKVCPVSHFIPDSASKSQEVFIERDETVKREETRDHKWERFLGIFRGSSHHRKNFKITGSSPCRAMVCSCFPLAHTNTYVHECAHTHEQTHTHTHKPLLKSEIYIIIIHLSKLGRIFSTSVNTLEERGDVCYRHML